MKINKYPDGSSYVTVPDYGTHNDFTFRVNSYEDLWHLNQLVDAWGFRYNKKPTITIPNLIDAQADRRFAYDQSSGLKLVCNFLNRMKADFKIFHPHNPEVVEVLMDNVTIIDNKRFISNVLTFIHSTYPAVYEDKYIGPPGYYRDDRVDKQTILMSSDAGGFKPLMKLCGQLEWTGSTFSASKYRPPNGDSLIQVIDRDDFDGQDILIVDDISVYGGTFKGLATMLKERNCGKLYLAVSHMTVQDLGKDPVTNYFEKVFTTNSKFDFYTTGTLCKKTEAGEKVGDISNLEIIKLF